MRKAIAILLIPFLLFGQAVGVAHEHSAAGTGESTEHDFRPHVHLAGGHAHSHDAPHVHIAPTKADADVPEGDRSVAQERHEHDSDAIYAAGTGAATHRKNLVDESGKLLALAILTQSPAVCELPSHNVAATPHWQPPDDSGGCPLYLRILFIRC